METMSLKSEKRQTGGTRVARDLRKTGRLPVVIYGHGEPPESISLDQHEVELALKRGARTLKIDLRGESKPYLIKEVQYDHFAATPIHIDLARVDLNERVRVKVGIELRGVPKGVSEGGVLDQSMGQIEVECLVTDIPDTLHPLVSQLALGETLYVKDLKLPPGVVAVADPDDRIATVRLIVESAAAPAPVEGEESAVAEPERIGRIKKDEEGAEEKK
jgi:large subunit ribosomal protein L25